MMQTHASNHLGGFEDTYFAYTFTGKVKQRQMVHTKRQWLMEIPIEYKKTNTHTNANKKNAIINVNINAPDDAQQDYICLPNFNGKPILEYTERGSYSFEYEYQIDSIFFVVVKKPFILQGTGTYMCYNEVKTETIYPYLSFGESIDVTINIIDSLFRNRAFKNEKIKIKKGKLYFYEKGRYNKLRLKK